MLGSKKKSEFLNDAFNLYQDSYIPEMELKTENTAPDWMKDVKKLKNFEEELTEQHLKKITELRFLGCNDESSLRKQIESYVPEEYRSRFDEELESINSYAENAIKLLKGYKVATEHLAKKLIEYGRKINDPVERHRQESHVIVKLKHDIDDLNMKRTEYINKFKSYEQELENSSGYLMKTLDHYKKKKMPDNESRTGNFILILFVSVFGLTVMWALSKIDPGTVVMGSFIEGNASPVVLSMLTATVIFLLISLSHHKLK
jgi:chromosome segregation ATPase